MDRPDDNPAYAIDRVLTASDSSKSARSTTCSVSPTEVDTRVDGALDAAPWLDPINPRLYLNRELAWLAFNWRVLAEATDERSPLLQRLRFISIVSSNLDEFFMKRVGALKMKIENGQDARTMDGRTAGETVTECCMQARQLETAKGIAYQQIQQSLREQGVAIEQPSALTVRQRADLRLLVKRDLLPALSVQPIDTHNDFPFVPNQLLHLLVSLIRIRDDTARLVVVGLPSRVAAGGPFLALSNESVFVHRCDAIAANLDLLFPDEHIASCCPFYVNRRFNKIPLEERSNSKLDQIAQVSEIVSQRATAPIVRLVTHNAMSEQHKRLLADEYSLDMQRDVVTVEDTPCLVDVIDLCRLNRPDLQLQAFTPAMNPSFRSDVATQPLGVFDAIEQHGSILLSHPYECFMSSVGRFLREAADCQSVSHIKMTLYRTSSDGAIINALIRAAEQGKDVAVIIELKASFDEEKNMRWTRLLRGAGVAVHFGPPEYKTHCKLIHVMRDGPNGQQQLAHVGTGNYHAATARHYSDFGLLTDDATICAEVNTLFDSIVAHRIEPRDYRQLLVAPHSMKRELLQLIENEARNAEQGRRAHIRLKANALEDAEVTRALYAASQSGVMIDLIIRDCCRLRPGIQGLSDTVRVVSIVGRFLEHARLYYFHADGEDVYLLGSADLMSRNLDNRVELLCPVHSRTLKMQLRQFLSWQLESTAGLWEMDREGHYHHSASTQGTEHSQERMMRAIANA